MRFVNESSSYKSTFQKYKRRRVVLFFISFLFLISGSIIAFSYVIQNRIDERSRAGWDETGLQGEQVPIDDKIAPVIVNVPPKKAVVGEQYSYFVKFSDPDSKIEDISVSIKTAPAWLRMNENILTGIPLASDVGSNKIILYITDGYNKRESEFFIAVEFASNNN